MNIRFNFSWQVCFCFFMLCQTVGLYAQPPVYKITKSVSTDARSRLFLLNENSDVAGFQETEITSSFAPVRWGVEDTVPILLGEIIVDRSLSYDVKAMNDGRIIVGSEKRLEQLPDNSGSNSSTRAVFWGANDTEPAVLESLGPYEIIDNFEKILRSC